MLAGMRSTMLGIAAAASLLSSRAVAEVVWQNTGHLKMSAEAGPRNGWERVYTQQVGIIDVVPTPTFQGTEAIRSRQTYQGSGDGRYHSVAVKFDLQRDGQDYYYGQAFYLLKDWQFHNQNVTFQQWG